MKTFLVRAGLALVAVATFMALEELRRMTAGGVAWH